MLTEGLGFCFIRNQFGALALQTISGLSGRGSPQTMSGFSWRGSPENFWASFRALPHLGVWGHAVLGLSQSWLPGHVRAVGAVLGFSSTPYLRVVHFCFGALQGPLPELVLKFSRTIWAVSLQTCLGLCCFGALPAFVKQPRPFWCCLFLGCWML